MKTKLVAVSFKRTEQSKFEPGIGIENDDKFMIIDKSNQIVFLPWIVNKREHEFCATIELKEETKV